MGEEHPYKLLIGHETFDMELALLENLHIPSEAEFTLLFLQRNQDGDDRFLASSTLQHCREALRDGAYINSRNENVNILHNLLVRRDIIEDVPLLEYLVKQKADVNARNKYSGDIVELIDRAS